MRKLIQGWSFLENPLTSSLLSSLIVVIITFIIPILGANTQVRILKDISIGEIIYTEVYITNPSFSKPRGVTLTVSSDFEIGDFSLDYPVKTEFIDLNNQTYKILVIKDIPPQKSIALYFKEDSKVSLYDPYGEDIEIVEGNSSSRRVLSNILLNSGITGLIYFFMFFIFASQDKKRSEHVLERFNRALEELAEVEENLEDVKKEIKVEAAKSVYYRTESYLWTNVVRDFLGKLSVSESEKNKFFSTVKENLKNPNKEVGTDIEFQVALDDHREKGKKSKK